MYLSIFALPFTLNSMPRSINASTKILNFGLKDFKYPNPQLNTLKTKT